MADGAQATIYALHQTWWTESPHFDSSTKPTREQTLLLATKEKVSREALLLDDANPKRRSTLLYMQLDTPTVRRQERKWQKPRSEEVSRTLCHFENFPSKKMSRVTLSDAIMGDRKHSGWEGRIEATRAESHWIVAARPLCHFQYPILYLSHLQRILLAAQWELRFKVSRKAHPSYGVHQQHVPLGDQGPLLLVGKRTAGARITSSPDSDLEAFSHNPTHSSFAPLAFQPSAMTNCANQRFLSY
ncbi:unnamed protein product [Lathyrus sativus]|nr:unnamed protein product [Lathyrus sativus]